MTKTLKLVFEGHALSTTEFREWMGWSRVTVHRKLAGERSWTMDEVCTAARFLRSKGVPMTDADVQSLTRTA